MGVPAVSASSSIATDYTYNPSLTNAVVSVFSGRGNLFGFLVEENGGANVFIQMFDAAAPGDVTLGVTAPTITFRIEASKVFGKDVNDSPLRFFSKGCQVAITSTRTGAGAPVAPATAHFWSYSSKY